MNDEVQRPTLQDIAAFASPIVTHILFGAALIAIPAIEPGISTFSSAICALVGLALLSGGMLRLKQVADARPRLFDY
jgi:hypothetical protein